MSKKLKLYEVYVSNIGKVHTGTNKKEAEKCFNEYKKMSQSGIGLAGNEYVALFANASVIKEHIDENGGK